MSFPADLDQSLEQELKNAIQKVLQHRFSTQESCKTCLLTLLTLLNNLLDQPSNPKVRKIRLANKGFHSKVVESQGVPVLVVCGFTFEQEDSQDYLVLKPEHEQTALLQWVRTQLIQTLQAKLRVPTSELPRSASQSTAAPGTGSFDVYQTRRHDGQSAAVGMSLGPPQGWKSSTETQLEALQKTQQAVLKKTSKSISVDWSAHLPNEGPVDVSSLLGPEPSAAEEKQLLAKDVQRQQEEQRKQQQIDNRGMTTKAMRDLEKLKKAKLYTHTVLLIQFADGCRLRGNFSPRNTIGSVLQSLQDEALVPFQRTSDVLELYMTPPRTVLTADKTLQELQLVPAAKIFASWKLPNDKLAACLGATQTSNKGWYLRPELFQQATADAAMPQSVLLLDEHTKSEAPAPASTTQGGASTTTAVKRKKTKAEKSAELLKRMMGGM